ncbi:hypothetical protein GGU10DRAFT_19651 [Lentinula aff. detonsa]|uniref:Uncharacterized protein n=1 Tax=Lentinula aff. detonsa TaxID=2804958 RepID=A0AA38L445_9AGAR|nr:hypothetical protein GGU10DRAFT_19651 [Lentinula aff. detonsa]
MKFNFNSSLSVFNSRPTRSVNVVRFLFLINGLLLFAAATTALPHVPRNVNDIDSSSQPVHWQPLTALVSRAWRPPAERTLHATVKFDRSNPTVRSNRNDAQRIAESYVEDLLDIAASVLDRTCPYTNFLVDKTLGYPTEETDRENFTVSFTIQGPRGPEYRVYQAWFSWKDEDGEIRSSGARALVAKIEKGELTYPKPT